MRIRPTTIDDYPALYALWNQSLTSVRANDDAPEMIERFLERNPALSVTATSDTGEVIGGILCGHDGRRGCLYHVAVAAAHRREGVGRAMVLACLENLRAAGIRKCTLVAFTQNDGGNAFWERMGFYARGDLFYRDAWLD